MKTKIVFLMVCWLSVASCFGEWVTPPNYPDGNVGFMAWGWGWATMIFAPSGQYINGIRYIPTSGTKRVGIRFLI